MEECAEPCPATTLPCKHRLAEISVSVPSVIGVYNKHLRQQPGFRVLGSCERGVSAQCKGKGQYKDFKLMLGCRDCRVVCVLTVVLWLRGLFQFLGWLLVTCVTLDKSFLPKFHL